MANLTELKSTGMKFIVSSSNLLKKLQLVSGVLNSSNTLPILDHFLFDIQEDQLVVSASDLETTMTTKISLEKSDNGGKVAIPAKILIDTLKTFADQPLSFSVDDAFGIEISSDNGKYRIAGQNGEEFPRVPDLEAPESVQISANALYNAINKSLFATGNDELRPVMSGVYFEINTDNITFVATDAHKLVRYRRNDIEAKRAAGLILPKKPLNLVKSALANTDAEVEMQYNDTNAFFSFDDIELICRLVEGKYPNYDAVIPKENPNQLIIDRLALLSSVKRISIFSNRSTHQIRLKISGSELAISAEDLDFASEANERLTCNYKGDDMEIGFNSRFLIEMLNNIESETVMFELSAPNRAGLLTPGDHQAENEDLLMLVMPVMLNN